MKFDKVFRKIIFLLCCFPATLPDQDASNMIPKQSAVKDTPGQTDLIDGFVWVFRAISYTGRKKE